MSKIAFLEKEIVTFSDFLVADEAKLRESSDNFALQLVVKNRRQRLDTLRHALMLAQAERSKEIMQLRLISPALERGAIPLTLLSKLTRALHGFLAASAYRSRFGTNKTRIDPRWSSALDLRLASVGHGSTRLLLTGNVATDLAGDSPLQSALDTVFRLLNAEQEAFLEALHDLGPVAAKWLSEFLGEMEKGRIAAEFTWAGPDENFRRWEGGSQEISRLRSALNAVEDTVEIITEILVGTVTLLAASGRIEITPEGSNSKLRIKYPKANQGWVNEISLYQRVEATVEKTSWPDPANEGARLTRYMLVAPISPK